MEEKNFMRECLMNTEIFKNGHFKSDNGDDISPNPNTVMDIRHRMVKAGHFREIPLFSKELIQTDALQILREERRKKLLKEKEERLVRNEINKMKSTFDNYRHQQRKQMENLSEHVKCSRISPAFQRQIVQFNKQVRRHLSENGNSEAFVRLSGHFKINSRQNDRDGSDGSANSGENRTATATMDNSNAEELHVSGIVRGQIPPNKSIIMQKFLDSEFAPVHMTEIQNRSVEDATRGQCVESENETGQGNDRWDLEKTWRSTAPTKMQKKHEKMKYVRKIEEFLARLEIHNADVNSKSKRPSTGDRISSSTNESRDRHWSVRKVRKPRATTARFREIEKNREMIEKKQEMIERLEADVTASQNDTCKRLGAMGKENRRNREKVKALKNLMNACEKDKSVRRYPVPEFVRNSERRREERNKRWKDIQERKRKAEEEKERKRLEMEEKMRATEEEEARKRQKELKERRRLEREMKEAERKRREKVKIQMKMAGDFNRKLLLLRGWRIWRKFMDLKVQQERHALEFNEKRLKRGVLRDWKRKSDETREFREETALRAYRHNLKKSCWLTWTGTCKERREQIQVAADWNDLKISEKYFKRWLTFTLDEQLHCLKLKQMADSNYDRSLKRKYFKILQEFPKMATLERGRERRKCFWRHKVQQILPDYRPASVPDDTDEFT